MGFERTFWLLVFVHIFKVSTYRKVWIQFRRRYGLKSRMAGVAAKSNALGAPQAI